MRERIIELPKEQDQRGILSFLEDNVHIPFEIARVYWIYGVPKGLERGGHAFKQKEEVIVALSGSFDIVLNDGEEDRRYTLACSYKALFIPRLTWHHLENFSSDAVCFVLASTPYDATDYLKDYIEYKKFISQGIKLNSCTSILQKGEPLIDKSYTVEDCKTIQFPVLKNNAGSLITISNSKNIPFDIKRVFYVHEIPPNEIRGTHAHKALHAILIAIRGSLSLTVDDGTKKRVIALDSPSFGVHLPPGIWGSEWNYAPGTVCLVLASQRYDESDYIRKYTDYLEWK